ncbi:MAG: hypothetical protein AAGA85_22370, partial [Bacteroidota bacterium]
LKYAQRLSEGFYIEPHNVWYFSYVLFVYGVRLLVPGTLATGLVIGQYLLGLLALVALTDAGRRIYDSNRAGIAVGFVYCVFVELTFWHSYVLCESLYVSGVCFLLWSAVRLEQHRRSRYDWLLLIGLATWVAFLKPTGIAVWASLAALGVYALWPRLRPGWRWTMGILTVLLILLAADRMLATFGVIRNYEKGEVIFGIRSLPYRVDYRTLMLTPPEDIYVPQDSSTIRRIMTFVVQHPWYWIKLTTLKLWYFLAHIRPYWSGAHNAFNLILLLPCYVLSFRMVRASRLPRWFVLASTVFVLVQCLSASLTSVDWDGRFLMPVLPVVFVLASGYFANADGVSSRTYSRQKASLKET